MNTRIKMKRNEQNMKICKHLMKIQEKQLVNDLEISLKRESQRW